MSIKHVKLPATFPKLHDYNTWSYDSEHTTQEQVAAQEKLQQEFAAHFETKFGKGVYISPNAAMLCSRLVLGDHSYIAGYCYVTNDLEMGSNSTMNIHCMSRGKVKMGNDVRIGAYATFMAVNHIHEDWEKPIRTQGTEWKEITIGDDVWIGSHVTILPGVTVGSHSIIGAGAIVTKDIPEYSIAVGNPAKVVRDRRVKKGSSANSSALEKKITTFGQKVAQQWPDVLAKFETTDPKLGPCYQEKADMRYALALRRTADAIEIAAMFNSLPALMKKEEYAAFFLKHQDQESGLFYDPWVEESRKEPELLESRMAAYNFLTVGYALELLDSKPLHPISLLDKLSTERLLAKLNSLPWTSASWGAGAWIDHYSTAAYLHKKYFNPDFSLEALFGWMTLHADSFTGMWGKPIQETGWIEPVNGFYRMTRGSYAQFGVPIPHPERAIDTILVQANDPRYFGEGKYNACNVLDVIHPLWLCAKQTQYRKAEATQWARTMLDLSMAKWRDGDGFGFDIDPGTKPNAQPSLQGTEMWLSIIFLLCEYLGVAPALGYRPKGVHRIEVALPLTK